MPRYLSQIAELRARYLAAQAGEADTYLPTLAAEVREGFPLNKADDDRCLIGPSSLPGVFQGSVKPNAVPSAVRLGPGGPDNPSLRAALPCKLSSGRDEAFVPHPGHPSPMLSLEGGNPFQRQLRRGSAHWYARQTRLTRLLELGGAAQRRVDASLPVRTEVAEIRQHIRIEPGLFTREAQQRVGVAGLV